MSRNANQVPPNKWMQPRISKVDDLFDLLANHPQGVPASEISSQLGVGPSGARQIVRDLRIMLGADDTITVITEAVGLPNQPHVYKLVGTYDQARSWIANRVGDFTTRIETIQYSAAALVRGADKRTLDGRRVVLIELKLRHLLEELAEITE